MHLTKSLIMLAAAGVLATVALAENISGAGATFPYPIYSKWADAYKRATGVGLNYQSIGSGGGIKQIEAKTVTFGASDMPLKPEQLAAAGLIQFPAIIGGAVPVVNIPGVRAGELTLDGPTIASIYLGEITQWNDPKIAKLNPRVKLPDTAIAPVYRADGSGTNFLFTNYLSKSSPEFAQKIGSSTSVQWPVGIGAKGNEGVANMAGRTEGAIGYVEFAYVLQNHMTYARLINRSGKVVSPSTATFQAAAANADWAHSDHYYLVLTDQPGAASWPITGASFILVYESPPDPAATAQALKFFSWAFKSGAGMAKSLDYVPLPASLVRQIEGTWRADIRAAGAPVWKG
ncbi:MAG TPA: phosphate ABC transporter substrate-binding protein PstS [Steroidobacteraceae bacterium]|nr:phosphate ABC transporter substrate-binding protein PstS [Steroidobacteraceae bacterium]